MMGRRIRYEHLLLAYLGLGLATSCTPQPPVNAVAATVPAHPAAPALLRQLDLNVPASLAASTLTPSLDTTPAAATPIAAPPFLVQPRTTDDAARALDCLTAAVYYEARSQSLDGQRAVAQVVLNRVRDPAFPASVCGVVYQGSTRSTGCQFSFTCDGSLDRPREPAAWARANVIATEALAGAVFAPVGSATFYHANYVSPWWAGSMTQVATIGAHIFYRWRGAMENALAFRQSYSGFEPAAGGSRTVASDGVDVHYATDVAAAVETISGVTIHRHADTDGQSVAPSDAGAVTEPARTLAVAGVRIRHAGDMSTSDAREVRLVAGVRIHRADDDSAAAGQRTT
jgi:spore germination cell wall hydrolase CwlJ-like protein